MEMLDRTMFSVRDVVTPSPRPSPLGGEGKGEGRFL